MSETKKCKSVCEYDWNINAVVALIKKCIAIKNDALKDISKHHVYIAPTNRKGAPCSVITIPGHNCPNCKHCIRSCYAIRHCIINKGCMTRSSINSAILQADPDRFFREVSGACKSLDKFRWFVSGDVDSARTFVGIIQVAVENPHCTYHLFTKNHAVVDAWLDCGHTIPDNLHLRLSEWPGMTTFNPHSLNLCSVYDADEFFEVHDGEAICSGNCTTCSILSTGCFDRNVKRVWIAKH
ncbi:MAG: hypothetical protein MJZ30_11535 [Paludibacteraceae bacterium]|nr:hypothetical protein [Paludibacteraceae bacterium]